MADHQFPNDVTVVIPCRDEARSLPDVLRAIPPGYRIIVVDNNSADDTAAVAESGNALVVTEQVAGYGSAVHAGIAAATTPIVCVLDGDGSLDPSELPTLVSAIRSGADLAVGRRRPATSSSWPWHARIGNRLVAWLIRRRFGLSVHDIGPMRVARTQAVLDLGITDRRSGYPLELLVRAAQAGWTVVEHDVTYRNRTAGRSKVSGSALGTVIAISDFARVLR